MPRCPVCLKPKPCSPWDASLPDLATKAGPVARGRAVAARFTRTLARDITFIEFDGARYHFQIADFGVPGCIAPDGSPLPLPPLPPGKSWVKERLYSAVACYPPDLDDPNGLAWLIRHGATQNPHERFEQGPEQEGDDS